MSFASEIARRTDNRLRYFLGEEFVAMLTEDATLCELTANPDGSVFVSRAGVSSMVHVGEIDPAKCEAFICAVASSLGQVIDRETNASWAGEMPTGEPWFGARMQMALPPLAAGPTFTMRVHAKEVYTLQDYVDRGILSEQHRDEILRSLANDECILVVGGTFSGKTTLLNAIVSSINDVAPETRLLIAEDRREIQSSLKNTTQLKTQSKTDGKGLDMIDVVKIIMSSRPDKIVVGEIRDESAAMFIRAQNSGHGGGMCSIHASTARGALAMIESYNSQGKVQVSRQEIANAVNMIVVIKKDKTHPAGRVVSEVVRLNAELSPDGGYQMMEV